MGVSKLVARRCHDRFRKRAISGLRMIRSAGTVSDTNAAVLHQAVPQPRCSYRIALTIGAVVTALGISGARPEPAVAAGCVAQLAPGKFPFRGEVAAKTLLPTNVGIVPQGFVGLRDVATVPGIDVSKWQDATDFVELKNCLRAAHFATGSHDGRHPESPFVYVRITAGEDPDRELEYATHWANVRHENLFVGPYHHLDIIDARTAVSKLTAVELAELQRANLESAEKQAATFVDRFARLLTLDPAQDLMAGDLGKPYLPIVLDISDRPQTKYSMDDVAKIGAIYGAAACRWMERVRGDPSFSGQPVMMFTTAYIFRDYGLASAPCNLRAGQVWISQHTANGDRQDLDPDPAAREAAKQLCLNADGKDVCIMQQYTSYGGFALFRRDAGLDLDRFFGAEASMQTLLQSAKHPERWGPQ